MMHPAAITPEAEPVRHDRGPSGTMTSGGRADAKRTFLVQLPLPVIADFFRLASSESHAAGGTILSAGDRVKDLLVLISGEVEVTQGSPARSLHTLRAGECLAKRSLLSQQPSSVTIRARTAVEVARLESAALGTLTARHPELGASLEGRSAPKIRPGGNGHAAGVVLSGSLGPMAVAELVQFLHVSRKTGLLAIESGRTKAEIHLAGGDVRHVRLGPVEGDDAFYQLVRWKEGSFSFSASGAGPERTIRTPTMTLLLEAMRQADEAGRSRAGGTVGFARAGEGVNSLADAVAPLETELADAPRVLGAGPSAEEGDGERGR